MKIFNNGLQRNGTNYTLSLLKLNTEYLCCNAIENYHKHNLYKQIKPDCDMVLTVVKNPYLWIESILFRNPVDIVKYHSDYKLDDKDNYLENLLSLYYDFYTGWMNANSFIVRYEDLLQQDSAFNVLKDKLEIKNSPMIFPELVKDSEHFQKKDIKYYLWGLPGGKVRLPLVDATESQVTQLREDLKQGGVKLN